MAEGRPIVLVSLADRVRAEELAAWLAEYEGMRTLLRDEVDDAARPGGTRLDAVVTDRPHSSGAPTVLLAEHSRVAQEDGIRAVLPLASAGSLVAAAIRLALAGYRTVPANDQVRSYPPRSNGHSPLPVLTQREREVIALLAEGASNKVIARRLDISVHTAKFHVAAILEKLGAVNRTDAIATAMRDGLVLL